MNQRYTYPWDDLFYGPYPQYAQPGQSRYHNLGMNGYNLPGGLYPGKNLGMMGDYGPRQVDLYETPAIYQYPLDRKTCEYISDAMDQQGAIRSFSSCNRRA